MTPSNENRQPEQVERVDVLLPDPSEPDANHRIISVWSGKGGNPDVWGLYASPRQDEYVEVCDDDIIATRRIDTAVSGLRCPMLPVRATSELRGTAGDSINIGAEFLEGPATADSPMFEEALAREARASLGCGGPLGNKDYTNGLVCRISMLFACATHVVRDVVCTAHTGVRFCEPTDYLP
jgi:hypothetical protein